MSGLVLTAYDGKILGPIANVLGYILDAIYNTIGFQSVILSIVEITIVIYMAMLPLTIKQQKFSRLSQAMQPEIQAIQNKYKGKKDQASMQAMQSETQLVYQKYGVSPSGSCIQMLIQMPILFALYRVFYNIPAYITSFKSGFGDVITDVVASSNYKTVLPKMISDWSMNVTSLPSAKATDKIAAASGDVLNNYIVDIFYKIPSDKWDLINSADFFNGAISGDTISNLQAFLHKTNYFLGLSISDTPWSIIKMNFTAHQYGFIILAILIPVLSYLTQLANIKLMPTASNGNDQMAAQMKTMNTLMPLMSLVFCFNVPVALGIYWICSALVRVIQQFFINRHFKNLNLDEIIEKNEEKAKKAREKAGIAENSIRNQAAKKTKSFNANIDVDLSSRDIKVKSDSLTAKANKVKEFNERNSQK